MVCVARAWSEAASMAFVLLVEDATRWSCSDDDYPE
jgi:hypothetical protein